MKNLFIKNLICITIILLSINSVTAQNPDEAVTSQPDQFIEEEPVQEKSENTPKTNEPEQEKKSLASRIFAFDPPVKKGPNDKKWLYSLSGGLMQKMGNTVTFTANGHTSFIYDNGLTEFSLSYEMYYGEVDKKINEHNGSGVIMLDHYVHPRVELFLFSLGEYNAITDLQFRNYSGMGAKFVIVKNSLWATDISLAPIYQYEKYAHLKETHEARASLRYRIKLTPVAQFKLHFTTFYIPAFDSIENYRFTIDTFAEVPIKEFSITDQLTTEKTKSGLYFQVGYKRDFNNKVPEGTNKEDQKIYLNIALKI